MHTVGPKAGEDPGTDEGVGPGIKSAVVLGKDVKVVTETEGEVDLMSAEEGKEVPGNLKRQIRYRVNRVSEV